MFERAESAVQYCIDYNLPVEVTEVEGVQGNSISDDERDAVEQVYDYYNSIRGQGSRNKGITHTGSLTVGGRLVLNAYRDARYEWECACRANPDVDVTGGERIHTLAVRLLFTVIDWGYDNWFRDPKMRAYFKPDSLFRKGKWRDRASWADPVKEDSW
jgi:hypothetical protein